MRVHAEPRHAMNKRNEKRMTIEYGWRGGEEKIKR